MFGKIFLREVLQKFIMFTGIMDAPHLKQILEVGLLPFIQEVYPDGHRLYQDSDSKQASICISDFLKTVVLSGGQLLPSHQI